MPLSPQSLTARYNSWPDFMARRVVPSSDTSEEISLTFKHKIAGVRQRLRVFSRVVYRRAPPCRSAARRVAHTFRCLECMRLFEKCHARVSDAANYHQPEWTHLVLGSKVFVQRCVGVPSSRIHPRGGDVCAAR